MPVQRLPRLELLWKDLCKKLPDVSEVRASLAQIEETNQLINAKAAQAEMAQKVFEIQRSFPKMTVS